MSEPSLVKIDCNFIKNRLLHRSFLVNFAKTFKTTFVQNTSGQNFKDETFKLLKTFSSVIFTETDAA